MGVPVTVDSDDLEALLFATGAIQKIEFALQADRHDPQAQQGRAYFYEARRRLNVAKLGATRVADGMLQPLSEVSLGPDAIRALHQINKSGGKVYLRTMQDQGALRPLRMAHLVELASVKTAEFWGADQPEYSPVAPDNYMYVAVRLTERGAMWINAHPEIARFDADGNRMFGLPREVAERIAADTLQRSGELPDETKA